MFGLSIFQQKWNSKIMGKIYETTSLQFGCTEYNQEFEISPITSSYNDFDVYLRYIIPIHLQHSCLKVFTLEANQSQLCIKRKPNEMFSIYKYNKEIHIDRHLFGGRIANDIFEIEDVTEDANRIIEKSLLSK